jgi:hypothetical protein
MKRKKKHKHEWTYIASNPDYDVVACKCGKHKAIKK